MANNDQIIVATDSAGLEDRSGAVDDYAFIEGWLRVKAANPHTRRAYERPALDLVRFLEDLGLDLRTCTLVALEDWISTLSGKPATIRLKVSAVKSLFSLAKQTGYCQHNVASVVKAPKVPNDLAQRILTEEQVHAIFAASSPRAEPFIRLLYYSAARVSELCQLRWGHVVFSDDKSAVLTILEGKGGETRHIRLTPSQAAVLLELRPDEVDLEAYVFATRTGRALHPSEAVNMVRRAATKAAKSDKSLKGRRVSPHWLRHSHATHALNRGAPPQLVQATLGHASLATTSRYAHANPDESSGRYLGD